MRVVALAFIVVVVLIIAIERQLVADHRLRRLLSAVLGFLPVESAVRDRRCQRRAGEQRKPVYQRRAALGARRAGAEAAEAAAPVAVHRHR